MSPIFDSIIFAAGAFHGHTSLEAPVPVIVVQFEFTVVSGFLKGEIHGGNLRYNDAALRGSGTETVPAESVCFPYRSRTFNEGNTDSPPMLTFVDGVLDKLTMSGGSSNRFQLNTGFKAKNFKRKSEAALRDGAQYFVYYDRNGFYAGAGTVSYTTTRIPAPDGELVATAATLLGGSRERAIHHLLSFLCRHTHLTNATYDGTTYRELPNPWSNGTGEPACEDTSSDGSDCPMHHVQRVVPAQDSAVTLSWEWDYDQVYDDNEAMIPFLEQLMGGPDILFMSGEVSLVNRSGWNCDHRGSDHCMLRIPTRSQVVLHDPSISALVQAIYAVKSHKFDGWYEMYDCCRVSQHGQATQIAMLFDHGS